MCEKALSAPGVGVGSPEAFQAGYCIGATDAAFAALVMEGVGSGRRGVCPKEDGKDPLELVKVVTRHLKANPQEHTKPAALSIRTALTRAYPCS